MSIKDKIFSTFENERGKAFSRKEIIDLVLEKYPETNRSSIIPSDYCYNITNKGIPFDNHLFEHIEIGRYKVLGPNYKYNGDIYHCGNLWGKWIDGNIKKF